LNVAVEEIGGSKKERKAESKNLLNKKDRNNPKNINGNRDLVNDQINNKNRGGKEKIDNFSNDGGDDQNGARKINFGNKRRRANKRIAGGTKGITKKSPGQKGGEKKNGIGNIGG
jgi:hypothetical protein